MDYSTKEPEKQTFLDTSAPEDEQEDKMEETLEDSDDSSDDEQAESAEITALREFVSEMTTQRF